MNIITVNGKTVNVGDSKNIVVKNGICYVDGRPVAKDLVGEVTIRFEGNVANLNCTNAVINGNVLGNVDCTSATITGNVTGDVDCTSVKCNDIQGDVDATSVNANIIHGDVDATTVKSNKIPKY